MRTRQNKMYGLLTVLIAVLLTTCDNGSGGWTNFTASTADMSYNGKYLRYYAASSGGSTLYSNVVSIWVVSLTGSGPWEVTIAMYDAYDDGWNGSGALRIMVNGVEIAAGVKVSATASQNTPSGQKSSNTYTFSVKTGDVVQLHWVAGSDQGENSFIVYYTAVPPSPAFTASNNDSWNGANALIYRLRDTMTSTSGGQLLSFITEFPILFLGRCLLFQVRILEA